MKLKVKRALEEDVFRDVVRIPEKYRVDVCGRPIPDGRICELTVSGKRKLLALRGLEEEDAVIHADSITRDYFGLLPESTVEIDARLGCLWDELVWAWKASDPTIRALGKG